MTKLEKSLLKQKLLNYQKEIQTETILKVEGENIFLQNLNSNCFSSKNLDPTLLNQSQEPQNQEYLRYLSQFTFNGINTPTKSQLTRKNIQVMNKKTKLLRSSYYQSPHNFQLAIKISNSPYKNIIHKELTSKTNKKYQLQTYRNYTQKSYKSQQLSQTCSQFLTIRKSKCQTIQHPYQYMKKKDFFPKRSTSALQRKKSSLYAQRAKTAQQKRKQQKQCKSKTLQCPQKQISGWKTKNEKELGLIVNQFTPKLKSKSLQDNIKVMANIMKRKIGLMNGDEIYNYVTKISQKREPMNYFNSSQKNKKEYTKK